MAGRLSGPPGVTPGVNDAVTRAVKAFVPNLVRAIRACRLYPAGSSTRRTHLETCEKPLLELLDTTSQITLGIREGSFLFGDDVVFTDDDVRTGPTHLLAAHAIFEITFQAGLGHDELEKLIFVLAEEKGYGRRRNESYVTLLWRHHFRHVRYRHIDMVGLAVSTDQAEQHAHLDDQEVQEIRGELGEVVRSLSIDEANGQDIIALSDRALDTPVACHQAMGSNLKRIEWAIGAFAGRTPARDLDALKLELRQSSSREPVVVRLADAVLTRLAVAPDPSLPGLGIEMVVAMYIDLLRGESYAGAKHLVDRARELRDAPTRPEDFTLGTLLIASFAADAVIGELFEAIEKAVDMRDASRVAAVIRAVGEVAVDPVLSRLDAVEKAQTRELMCAVAIEITGGRRADLARIAERARPEVALQLIRAAQGLPSHELAGLLASLIGHAHPSVRALAIRTVGGFSGPVADQLVAKSMSDVDPQVRTAAVRAIATKPSDAGHRAVAAQLVREDVLERDSAELRALFHAHATIGGEGATEDLTKLLASAAAITSGHKSATIEAVANALAASGTDAARAVLAKGAKSLNPRLRGPAKAALAGMEKAGGVDEMLAAFAATPTLDVARPIWPASLGLETVAARRSTARTSLAPTGKIPGGPTPLGTSRGSLIPNAATPARGSTIPNAATPARGLSVPSTPSTPPPPRGSIPPPATTGRGSIPPATTGRGSVKPSSRPGLTPVPRSSVVPPSMPSTPPEGIPGAIKPRTSAAPPPGPHRPSVLPELIDDLVIGAGSKKGGRDDQ